MLWEATVVREGDNVSWRGLALSAPILSACFAGTSEQDAPAHSCEGVTVPDIAALSARRRHAILSGDPSLEQEFRVILSHRLYWLHEKVQLEPAGANAWQLRGVVTDVTSERERHNPSEEEIQQILKSADCLLWRARVFRLGAGIDPNWVFYIPPSKLYKMLFGGDPPEHPANLWLHALVPDLAEMDQVSSAAILGGAPEYKQEFRVISGDNVLWIHEHVSITRVSTAEWSLTGIAMDVTAIREAGEARRQKSEAQIQQILARADCMIWHAQVEPLDADFNELKWELYLPKSELFQRLFNTRPGETAVLDWQKLKVPEYPQMMAFARSALRAGEPGYEQEFHVPREGQPPVWLHEQVSIRPAGPGRWDFIGVITDISVSRATEEARRKSDTQLEHILTAADCLIWQANVRSNRAGDYDWEVFAPRSVLYRRLFGGEPLSTANGRLVLNWWELKVPELAEMEALYQEAFRLRLPGYEHEFRAFVGPKTFWLREQVSIKYLDSGHFELVGVITDVSARREAELELAAEKERLAVTLRAMAEGVITTDIQGRVQFINPAAAVLIQCEASAVVGQPISEVCALQDAHSGKAVSISRLPLEPVDRVTDLPAETRLVTRSGVRRNIEGCCAPIHSSDIRVIGTVLVFRDVTERERMEQEIVRASRLESVGILAGGIAHDFNNILTAIMGNLSIAKLDAAADTDLARSLAEAERATLRARDLTQQLLTFAKGGEPVRSAVDLAAIVRDVAEFTLHGSLVKSVFDFPADLWPIDADQGQISRVVQNLVINAFQAMPNGGIVRLSARNEPVTAGGRRALEPGDYVHISIADTGTGIGPENLPRIFDPYFTTKQTGSGLGLAATYSIVKKHRGLIDVESELGRSTTFHIWLPALRADAPAAASGEPEKPGALKGRILFMDDEASIRHMASAIARRIGLDIVAVNDGREAVDQFRAARAEGRPFALVIMDLTVPGGMGGREALDRLREIDPDVKAIVSSGYSSDPVLANHRDYGFCGVITKPYDVSKFASVIAQTLSLK